MPSSEYYTNMTCGLKVDTQSPGWYNTLTKVLKKINGVHYTLNAEEGMAYISGRVKPNKILRKIAKAGKHAELCWVETGNQNHNLYGYDYDDRYIQYYRGVDPYWNGPRPGYWHKQYYYEPAVTQYYYPQRSIYPYHYDQHPQRLYPYYENPPPYAYPSWA